MKHFKSRNDCQGFTFVEVALAVLMLGIMLTAALGLQQSSFASIIRYSERFQHILLLKNILFDAAFARAQQQGYDHLEKKASEDNKTSFRYGIKKVAQNSSLHSFENILCQTAEATWAGPLRTNKETLISFVYKPEKKEKEKS
jgi:prepilin-type N-terminal cleavage/methylation domain-containing protein